ncbi:hypothetical protein BCR33DRAFT_845994 [Rhizoclosmatium globosum]|uniref:Structure-specific endonuclease subunit SLX4 n=1 Tax=Rhizoclosmatium globosum TaxID=329046 RepID=A0A1Y2CY95_9FUNG|nr:hypothetical protein BCR33DRAFT_845994 [Rhizoclosmatium globosum]|eukprot:ORY52012.1 hypothetical protein BCR33DRAFT_845994 [Rhizoclosmatium globosum]
MALCPICDKFFASISELQDIHIVLCLSGAADSTGTSALADSGNCPVCSVPFASLHPSVVWDDHVDSCLRNTETKLKRALTQDSPSKKTRQTTLAFVDAEEYVTNSISSTSRSRPSKSTKPTKSVPIQLSSDDDFCAVKTHVKVLRFDNSSSSEKVCEKASKISKVQSKLKKKSKSESSTSVYLGEELERHLNERYKAIISSENSSSNIKTKKSEEVITDCTNDYDGAEEDDGSTDMWKLAATSESGRNSFTAHFLEQYLDNNSNDIPPLMNDNINNKLDVNHACSKDILMQKRVLDAKILQLRLEYDQFVRSCLRIRNAVHATSNVTSAAMESKDTPTESQAPTSKSSYTNIEQKLPTHQRRTAATIVISDDSDEEPSPKKKSCLSVQSTPPPYKNTILQTTPQISTKFQRLGLGDKSPVLVEATPPLPPSTDLRNNWIIESTPTAMEITETVEFLETHSASQGILNDSSHVVHEMDPDYQYECNDLAPNYDHHSEFDLGYDEHDENIEYNAPIEETNASPSPPSIPSVSKYETKTIQSVANIGKSVEKVNALDKLMKTAAAVAAGNGLVNASDKIGGVGKGKKTVGKENNAKKPKPPKPADAANTAGGKKKKTVEDSVKPDYANMSVQELEKIASKYGIRKLAKVVLVDQLNKIWDTLHPSNENGLSAAVAAEPPKDAISKSSNSTIEETDVFPTAPTTKVKASRKKAAATVSNEPEISIDQQIHDYIKRDEALHSKVLRYEPLEFESLHQEMKASGIKCSKKILQSFLDARGITTRNSTPRE